MKVTPPFAGCQYYDRQGQTITYERFADLAFDERYRHLADSRIGHRWRTGIGVYRVSTIWLGFDLTGHDQPLIFETCVFDHLEGASRDYRWPDEELALYAHRFFVKLTRGKWRKMKDKHLIVPRHNPEKPLLYFEKVARGGRR